MIRFGPVYGGGGFPLWGGIIGLVLFAVFVGAVIWLIIALTHPGRPVHPQWYGGGYAAPRWRPPALEELDLAYARGQLSREEYLRRRADLSGWPPPGGPPPGFSGPAAPAATPGDDPGTPASS